jgi:hypothetical protein
MAQLSNINADSIKPDTKSVKIDTKKIKQLNDALDLIEAHIGPLKNVWSRITEEKRISFLNNSPVIARIIKNIVEVLK